MRRNDDRFVAVFGDLNQVIPDTVILEQKFTALLQYKCFYFRSRKLYNMADQCGLNFYTSREKWISKNKQKKKKSFLRHSRAGSAYNYNVQYY